MRNLSYWRAQANAAELNAFEALRDFIQTENTTAQQLLEKARDARRGQVILFREESGVRCDARELAAACGQDAVESLARACNCRKEPATT